MSLDSRLRSSSSLLSTFFLWSLSGAYFHQQMLGILLRHLQFKNTAKFSLTPTTHLSSQPSILKCYTPLHLLSPQSPTPAVPLDLFTPGSPVVSSVLGPWTLSTSQPLVPLAGHCCWPCVLFDIIVAAFSLGVFSLGIFCTPFLFCPMEAGFLQGSVFVMPHSFPSSIKTKSPTSTPRLGNSALSQGLQT